MEMLTKHGLLLSAKNNGFDKRKWDNDLFSIGRPSEQSELLASLLNNKKSVQIKKVCLKNETVTHKVVFEIES